MIYLRGTDRFRFKTAVEDEETIRTELNKVLSAAVAEKDKPFSGQPWMTEIVIIWSAQAENL